jgi:hypothetical protein
VVFVRKTNTSVGTSTVLEWFGFVWLFHIPETRNLLERFSWSYFESLEIWENRKMPACFRQIWKCLKEEETPYIYFPEQNPICLDR